MRTSWRFAGGLGRRCRDPSRDRFGEGSVACMCARDRLPERRVVARLDDRARLFHRAADRAQVIDEVGEDRLAVTAVGSRAGGQRRRVRGVRQRD